MTCNCSGCLEVRAVENLIRIGLAQDYNNGCELLELIVPSSELTIFERIRRFKLLTGPYGYMVYKMLEARKHEHG